MIKQILYPTLYRLCFNLSHHICSRIDQFDPMYTFIIVVHSYLLLFAFKKTVFVPLGPPASDFVHYAGVCASVFSSHITAMNDK